MPDFQSMANIPQQRRWRSQSLPAPVVVAIVCRPLTGADGRSEPAYLLIKRVADPYRGRWALVGGKWDFGEPLSAAVVREVLEETGLEAEFVALRGIVSERLLPDEPGGTGAAHFLLLVCQVDARDGRASEQQEGAVAWFSPGQIEVLNRQQQIIPSDYLMLQRFAHAPEIAHYEADMISAATSRDPENARAQLIRFEEAA